MEAKVKELEMKITQLESQLKNVGSTGAQPQIDPEEMKVFRKVGSQLGFDFGTNCGVNECQVIRFCTACRVCTVCIVCRVCRVCNCINECSCGPCILGSFGTENIDRFGGMGF